MPKLISTMTEGLLIAWKKKKGDKVSAGDVIAEIENDKATMEWESPEDGTLTEIYVEEGGKVNVGDKIGFIAGGGEEAPKKEDAPKKEEKQPKAEEKKEKETAPPQKKTVEAAVSAAPPQDKKKTGQPTASPARTEEARVKASPVARRVAAEI